MAKFIEKSSLLFSGIIGWVVIAAAGKMILMGMFSSDYQNKLFLPFVWNYLEMGGNPWQRFYEAGINNAFPYPVVMLFVEALGASVIKLFGITEIFWVNFIFKLPMFFLELTGLYFLVRLYPEKRRYIVILYYMSPITLYGAYMHSQLDLVPTVFLILALYFLVSNQRDRERYGWGSLFTILAILSKLHILAVIPVIVMYLEKRDGLKKTVCYSVAVAAGLCMGILPFWSEGFLKCVLFNAEQAVLTQISFSFATVEMYIPIVAVLTVYLASFKTSFLNRGLFMNLCGTVFAVFLAFCPPMPGWYIWIVPFVAVFFTNSNVEKYKNMAVYALVNFLYLIYFVFFHNRGYTDLYLLGTDCSFLKITNSIFSNLLFTLMSGTLIYLIFSMYQIGVASNTFYKRKDIPFTIGVAGDSGSGKSTMIDVVEKCLGRGNLLHIEGDGDHRWERGSKCWDEYTALNPKANYLYRQANDLKLLRTGNSVKRVDYDHNTGKFTSYRKMKSRRYVMLCGLHSMYLPQTRKHLDLKIYMDSDETLRRYWKIQRDTARRGYSKEMVIQSIEERMPDAEKYIYPQKKYADLVVRYFDKTLDNCMVDDHYVRISVLLIVNAAVNIEPLVDELVSYGINIDYDYSDDLQKQIVNIDADNLEGIILPVGQIAENVIPQLEEITRENLNAGINGKDGIIILFILLLISNKMQGDL